MHATINPDGSATLYATAQHSATAAPILTLPPAVTAAIQAATPHLPRPIYSPTPDAADYPDHHEETPAP